MAKPQLIRTVITRVNRLGIFFNSAGLEKEAEGKKTKWSDFTS